MRQFDAVVIGGGVIGCFTAMRLSCRQAKIGLIEAAPFVCTGISKANSGIVYAGYDHAPGSVKATFTVEANRNMEQLCEMLDVSFARPGSLMTATGPEGERVLRKKLAQGLAKGVPGLEIVSGDRARELEPMLGSEIASALWAPTTGVVDPWSLGIAAYEIAVQNGCEPMFDTKVTGIERTSGGYVIETDGEAVTCRAIVNCAGLFADRVLEMLFEPSIRLRYSASDYLVLDKKASAPKRVLFRETEGGGKGVTVIPTTHGQTLVASPSRPFEGEMFSTTQKGLRELREQAAEYLPGLDLKRTIRSFAAVRSDPVSVVRKGDAWVPDGKSIGSFIIDRSEAGFISALGIKTPGLTCCDQLGSYLAETMAHYLNAEEKHTCILRRTGIARVRQMPFEARQKLIRSQPSYGEVICRCEDITKGEILEAIRRGMDTPEKIKRYLGTGMGACQGSRCARMIEELLRDNINGNN